MLVEVRFVLVVIVLLIVEVRCLIVLIDFVGFSIHYSMFREQLESVEVRLREFVIDFLELVFPVVFEQVVFRLDVLCFLTEKKKLFLIRQK